MTAGESKSIGILIGTVDGLQTRIGAIEELLKTLDDKLDGMQEHVAPVAAQLARELAAYKVDESKWRVEVVAPLVEAVKKLEKGGIAEEALGVLKSTQRRTRRWLIGLSVTVAIAVAGFVIDYLRIRFHV